MSFGSDILRLTYGRGNNPDLSAEDKKFAEKLAEKLEKAGLEETAGKITSDIKDNKLEGVWGQPGKNVLWAFINETRENGETRESSAFVHFARCNVNVMDGTYDTNELKNLVLREDKNDEDSNELGISGDFARDLMTLMKVIAPNDITTDNFGNEMFRYAWDLVDLAKEQGLDKTAKALETALDDGYISRWNESTEDGDRYKGGDGTDADKIAETFAMETGENGNTRTRDFFNFALHDGRLTWSDYHNGMDDIEKDEWRKAEDALNDIATHYANGGINTETRRLTSFKSAQVRPHFEALIANYRDLNPDSSAQEAADWAIGELKDRLGNALQKNDSEVDDGEARGIFKNYVENDDRNGQTYALDIARTVYSRY